MSIEKKVAPVPSVNPDVQSPKKELTGSDTITVKNISNKILNLTHGTIPQGKSGKMTVAEYSVLSKAVEKE